MQYLGHILTESTQKSLHIKDFLFIVLVERTPIKKLWNYFWSNTLTLLSQPIVWGDYLCIMRYPTAPTMMSLTSCWDTNRTVLEDLTRGAGHRRFIEWLWDESVSVFFFNYNAVVLYPTSFSLHVACGVGASTRVISQILKCYPEAVLMRTTKGSTAKQCLNLTKAANKEEVKKLIKKYYMEVDQQYRLPKQPTSDRDLV